MNTNRIKQALAEGKCIYVANDDERRQLLELYPGEIYSIVYSLSEYYTLVDGELVAPLRDKPCDDTIIPFAALTLSRLAECLGVENRQKFIFKNDVYSVECSGEKLQQWSSDGMNFWREMEINVLLDMIAHPEEITPCPRWGEDEKEWAQGGITLGMTHVAKDSCDGLVYLYADEPRFNEICCVWVPCRNNGDSRSLYMPEDWPNVKPGTTVKLEEIKNG